MSLTSSLTLRYSIALILVAAILAATHVMSVKRIASTSADGYLIDTSGMQRMLSQRIGLLSLGLLSTWETADQVLADDMATAIKSMAANQATLKADWQERAVSGDADFSQLLAVGGLADSIDAFISNAEELHQRYIGARMSSSDNDMLATPMIIMAEKRDFLQSLDNVVKMYTQLTEQTSSHLHTIQTYSLAFGLIILLFEVLFIFKPMVSRIANCVDVLHEANEELHSMALSLSHGLQSPIVDSMKLMKMVDTSLSSGKVTDAATVSSTVYASMVSMDGVIAELLDVVSVHRKAVMNFTKLGGKRH